VEQACNAGIAWLAHGARVAGQGDPTEALDVLPSVDALDAMFGDGAAAYVRRRVVDRVLFAPETLATDGWDMLVGHIADEGAHPRLWRAAARLLRAGRPLHAARAAVALLRNAA